MKYYSVTIAIILLFIGWTGCSKSTEYGKYKKYAIRFADSEMVRFPEAWQLDHGKRFVWGYAQGLGALTMLKMWKATDNKNFLTTSINGLIIWFKRMVPFTTTKWRSII